MQKFGENGNEFWWNDDDQDAKSIAAGFLLIVGCILYLKIGTSSYIMTIVILLLILLFTGTLGCTMYRRKKKIPELYMNEQGVNIRGSFISWNWIIEMEIKTVSYGPTVKDSEMIFIYYHKPEETGEHTISIMPDEDEIEEIRRYIEAFWQYYKTE